MCLMHSRHRYVPIHSRLSIRQSGTYGDRLDCITEIGARLECITEMEPSFMLPQGLPARFLSNVCQGAYVMASLILRNAGKVFLLR